MSEQAEPRQRGALLAAGSGNSVPAAVGLLEATDQQQLGQARQGVHQQQGGDREYLQCRCTSLWAAVAQAPVNHCCCPCFSPACTLKQAQQRMSQLGAPAVQVYTVADSSLCLTGTAEVPLGALYMDQTLSQEQLPLRLAGYGHCFRTEAGAAGA